MINLDMKKLFKLWSSAQINPTEYPCTKIFTYQYDLNVTDHHIYILIEADVL